MGCISSAPEELERPNVDIDIYPHAVNAIPDTNHNNSPQLNNNNNYRIVNEVKEANGEEIASFHQTVSLQETASLHDWDTNDLISYICAIEDGKFCDPKYDLFKAGLQSLGINGKTINTLCYDPHILKDLGLNNDSDIILIQTKLVEIYANNEYFTYNNDMNKKQEDIIDENDEFFPSEWTFPVDDGEKNKNCYYVGQKLLIRSAAMQQVPSICIYVENNWIVIKYKTKSNINKLKNDELSLSTKSNDTNTSNSILPSPTNHHNIYKNMEKLHVMKQMARINKLKANINVNDDKKCNNLMDGLTQSDGDFFDKDKEYYGMSCYSTSNSVSGAVVPNCYIDPIMYEIMNDPVTSKTSGRTYDRAMIVKHVDDYGTDPFNQQAMGRNDLYPNKILKRAIDRWLKNNPNVTPI